MRLRHGGEAIIALAILMLPLVTLPKHVYADNYVGVFQVWGDYTSGCSGTAPNGSCPSGSGVIVTGKDAWNGTQGETESVSPTVSRATHSIGSFYIEAEVSGSNSLNQSSSSIWYDVNTIPVGYTSHTTRGVGPGYDCQDSILGGASGVKNHGSVKINTSGKIVAQTTGPEGTGTSVTLFSTSAGIAGPITVASNETSANTSPEESGVCLSDSGAINGIEAPLCLDNCGVPPCSPGPNTDNPLQQVYHHQTVLNNSSNHLIYWFPSDHTPSNEPLYVNTTEQYVRDAGSLAPYSNVLQQYCRTNSDGTTTAPGGSGYGGAVLTTSGYPDGLGGIAGPNPSTCGSSCITDQAIEDEVRSAINSVSGWSNVPGTSIYTIYTGPGESVCDNAHGPFGVGTTCSFNGNDDHICGYHAATSELIAYNVTVFPDRVSGCQVPSSYYPNGDVYADSGVQISSHELAETVTDPFGQGWCDAAGYQPAPGIGNICQGGEVADNCTVTVLESNNARTYLVSEVWDNGPGECSPG